MSETRVSSFYEVEADGHHSIEELIQYAVDIRQQGDSANWDLGAVCEALTKVHGVKAADVAANLNCTAARIRELAKTWRAFPGEAHRALELTWQHHRLAARTTEPMGWLIRASDNEWSTRELQAAIRAAKAGLNAEDEAAMERARRCYNLLVRVIGDGGKAGEWLQSQAAPLIEGGG